jgi:hypothetical protein
MQAGNSNTQSPFQTTAWVKCFPLCKLSCTLS